MAIILNRLQKKGPGRCFLWMLVSCWLGIAAQSQSQSQAQTPTAAPAPPWTVETLVTRTLSDGQPATMAVALRVPVNEFIKHVVLYTSPNTAPSLKIASGKTGLNLTAPWVRASALLNARGIVVVFADAPSDVKGTAPGKRASADARQDIQTAVAYLQKRFAGLPIHLGTFAGTAAPTLDAASRIDGVARIVVVSGGFLNSRTSDWRGLNTPVLLIHAPSTVCTASPFLEAQLVARKNGFMLVEAGYDKTDAKPECGLGSQHVLSHLETEFADTIMRWLDGAELPARIGYPHPQIAWREQVVTYPAPDGAGVNQLEMSLLLPDGSGPFPVAVFNHGDVDIEHSAIRDRQRIRALTVAWEFLRYGIAVAVPARRGVAMSEGVYPRGFSRDDSDPTYKARVHAQDILPALNYLRTRPEIDAQRIILAGQSAGGYSIMHIAGTNPPGVIGAVNFAGGRTDFTRSQAASPLNKMMVSGFEAFGKTSRVPTLWVFAENDSRYTADTIRASYAAFVKAGGVGRLVLSPPIAGDGHFIHNRPEFWRDALKHFVSDIGVLKERGNAGAAK